MKILVVDDEKMIRKGIVSILTQNVPGHEILEAANGQAAYDIFREEKPDLLVTDIKMPVMDGLELMKRVRAEDDEIAIIVVTGFDDFTYAHTALRCGASAYILKPVDKLELIETVEQLVKEKEAGQKDLIQRTLARCYADGGVALGSIDLTPLCPYRVVSLLNPSYTHMENLYHISPFNHGYLALIPACQEDLTSYSPSTRFGYSRVYEKIDDLQSACLEALVALYGRFLSPDEISFHSSGLGPVVDDIAAKVAKLVSQIGYSNDKEIEKSVEALFSIPAKADAAYYLFSMSEAVKNGLLSQYDHLEEPLMAQLTSLAHYDSLETWKKDLTRLIKIIDRAKRDELPDNTFITKALAYIENNYSKSINMAVVSNEVGISYTYFSEKFKEYMNVNFNEYLTGFRIKKAKEFLAKGCYRIYEVSEKCGFSGPRYFIKIFKQETGLTPTAYMTSVAEQQEEV